MSKTTMTAAQAARLTFGREVTAICDAVLNRFQGKPWDEQTKFVIEAEIHGAILNLLRNARLDQVPAPRVDVFMSQPGIWGARIGEGKQWEAFPS